MMRKNIFKFLAFLMLPALVAACYDDDSTLGDMSKVATIAVEDMENVSIVSYCGNKLNVTPNIDTRLSDSEMDFAWYIVRPSNSGTGTGNDDFAGFRDEKISDQKTLDYEVNLPSGNYTFVFEATNKATGLSAIKTMTVSVSTEFSKGFYILKDMGDGTSDVDLVTSDGKLDNLVDKITGKALNGAPVALSVIYLQHYIDDAANEMSNTTMLNLFTDKEYASFRTEDMHPVFNKQNIGFEDMSGVQFNNVVQALSQIMMLSSNGIYETAYSETGSGKIGLPVAEGSCQYIQPLDGMMSGFAYWNDTDKMIYSIDYNCLASFPLDYSTDGMNTANQKCIGSGCNYVGYVETVYFLTEDVSNGQRYLYFVDGMMQTAEVVRLDSDLHISKATNVACNGLNASIIYCVDGGRLYAYDMNTATEAEVTLPGMDGDGNVAFVTNQYFNMDEYGGDTSDNFNNLIVGRQEGNTYKLYFYDNLVGGVPSDKPFKTVEGNGKVKSIRYASSVTVGGFDLVWNAHCFPYSD